MHAIKEDVNIYMIATCTVHVYMCMYASERVARLVSKVSLTREVFTIIETIHLATLKCGTRTC